jgi:hypothetical protein
VRNEKIIIIPRRRPIALRLIMNIIKNLREPITLVTAIAIIGFTLFSMYNGTITWIWEGLAGVAVGILCLLAPEQLVKVIFRIINKLLNKLLGKDGDSKE